MVTTIPNPQRFNELIKQLKFHLALDSFQGTFIVTSLQSVKVKKQLKFKTKNSVMLNSNKAFSMVALRQLLD